MSSRRGSKHWRKWKLSARSAAGVGKDSCSRHRCPPKRWNSSSPVAPLLSTRDLNLVDGLADQRLAARASVLAAAHAAHPERFSAGAPMPAQRPTAVWINPPTLTLTAAEEAQQTRTTAVSLSLIGSG